MLPRRLESGCYLSGAERAAQLLLPAERCLVTTAPVAKHEAKHLARTLPWTLEERVLEPVEQLHVAHGPVSDGTAAVSAVNAAWLRQVLDELRAAGIEPEFACSELFLLPWQPGQWTVLLAADPARPAIVRHGAHAGFACARANLHKALQLLLNEYSEAPRQVLVVSADALAQDELTTFFPVLLHARISVQQKTPAQLLNSMALPPCNLLQGRFAPPLPWAQWWRQWRIAAILLAGLLLSDLALSAYEGLRVNRQAASLEAEALALYRTVQPDGAVVDPRLQLEQALASAGVSARGGFLGLLARMAPALQATPEARVQNLEYDGTGVLQVQVFTNDYAAAENLRVKLQQLGLEAELLGSNRVGGGSLTRLRVGGGA